MKLLVNRRFVFALEFSYGILVNERSADQLRKLDSESILAGDSHEIVLGLDLSQICWSNGSTACCDAIK